MHKPYPNMGPAFNPTAVANQLPPVVPTMPIQVSVVDPYVVRALVSLMGSQVIVETSRGNLRGIVRDVKPDHVVLLVGDENFFVRICEIIWVMPEARTPFGS